MPKKLRRLIVASCVIVFAMALFGATASGIDGVGVSVPQLQEPSQLTSSAPQVSVPSVSTPSVPSAPSVSTPSVTVPSVPSAGSTNLGGSGGGSGGGGSSSTSGGGSGGGGSGSSGGPASSSGGGGSPAAGGGSSSAGGGSGAFAKRGTSARKLAVERSQSRRLRREVKSMSACLGSLPTMQRRVLGLRAGLAGSALSRGAAARKLGISGARELRLERGGLRSLRGASRAGGCGGGSGGGASQIAARSWAIPQLQPMATLSQPAPLVSPSSLSGDGASAAQQDVKGDTASSSGPAGPEAPDKATDSAGLVAAVAPASGDAASSGWTPVIIFVALCLAALAAASVLAGRQMLGAGSGGPAHEPLSWLPFAAPDLLATRREEAPGSGGAVHETAAMEEAPAAPVATAVAVAPHVNGNGNGNGHVAHANGNGNGNGHATQANGIDNGNGHAPHANGNGNGNGHVAHASGNGNGNGHADAAYASATAQRLGRPAAIVLSGLVSLGLSRAVRGRRRR